MDSSGPSIDTYFDTKQCTSIMLNSVHLRTPTPFHLNALLLIMFWCSNFVLGNWLIGFPHTRWLVHFTLYQYCMFILFSQVMQFNIVELQFRQGIADVANEYALSGPEPVRQRRQANVAQNVTADNVFIVGPSPLIMNSNLNVVFFVQTDSGTIVNGTELTAAVQNEGATLAQEVQYI